MKTDNINNENPVVPQTTYTTNTGAVYGNGWTRIPGVCQIIEVSDSLVYVFEVCLVLIFAASCTADYENTLFWEWVVCFLGEQKHRWRWNGGGFTLSAVPSEGIVLIRQPISHPSNSLSQPKRSDTAASSSHSSSFYRESVV